MDLRKAEKYTQQRQKRRRWQVTLTCLAAVVVFCTTYALILPAVTLSSDTACGQEEHTHSEACYTAQETLSCELEEHSHLESCYQTCSSRCCGQEEHTHGADCYDGAGELLCPQPEHTHSEDCYPEGSLLCPAPEHTHETDCYDETGELICTETEHRHTDDCYQPQLQLICTQPEHWHGGDCRQVEQVLTCTQPEHTHTEVCRTAERELYYEDDDLSLTLRVESTRPLPEELSLSVEPLEDAALLDGESGDEPGRWILRQLTLLADGQPLDSADCRMTAQVQVKSAALTALKEELSAQEAAPEAEVGIALSLYQLDDTLGLRQLEEQLLALDETAEPFAVTVQDGLLAVRAEGTPNPHYTVQYYAYIPRFATSGETALTVYDTTGGKLPQNHKEDNPIKSIYLEKAKGTTDKNHGNATQLYQVKTTQELTRLYTENNYQYIEAPNTSYVNKLMDNSSYSLRQVWVLKEGKDPSGTNEADWDIHEAANVHFTNRAEAADESKNIIYIADNSVLRLVYDASDGSFDTSANFYDYDITSGKQSDGTWWTGAAGINSEKNYTANSKTTWADGRDLLAFGNSNTKTGLGNYKFDELYLNQYSKKDKTKTAYQLNYGCIFNLAKALDENGHIVYNEWLLVPNLFNDDGGQSVNGKRSYENSGLTFTRVGDTYTLSAAQVRDASGNVLSSVSDLQSFFNPSPNTNTTHTHIFTNNFWPVDNVPNQTDPKFGESGVTTTASGYVNEDNAKPGNWTKKTENFPVSDDGNAHNSYFGLQYAVEFTLTADYAGPLEYYFFGDDDMWVFLDKQLVCDIGGVHSTVGEYVNLWDYLDEGDVGTHTLTFFYTERGASGSTCYMNFTLPSVSGIDLERTTADLKIGKELIGGDPEKEFTFRVQFFDQNDAPILDDYAYTRYDAQGHALGNELIIHDGSQFALKGGEYVLIEYLPFGLRYQVQELSADGCTVIHQVNGTAGTGSSVSGSIQQGSANAVTFTNIYHQNLPVQKLGQDGTPLSGAVFTLSDADGNPLHFTQEEGGYRHSDSGTTELQVNENGLLSLSGLLPGTYTLTEITAPTGCQPMAEPIAVTVGADGALSVSGNALAEVVDGTLQVTNLYTDKTLTLHKEVRGIETDQSFTFTVSDGTDTKTVTLTSGGSTTLAYPYGTRLTITEPEHPGYSLRFEQSGQVLPSNPDGSCTVTLTEDITLTAVNIAGYELPATGGPGTLWYTMGGALLLLAAGALLLYKQRRKGGAASS